MNTPLARRLLRLCAEIAAIAVIAGGVGAGVLYWRLTQGPINLALIKPQLERALTKARNDQPVTFNRVTLEWSQDRARIEIAMSDVALYDSIDEPEAVTAKNASVTLRAGALLFGRIEPLRLGLENGTVRIPDIDAHTGPLDQLPQVLADLRARLFTYTLNSFELSRFAVLPASDHEPEWSIRDVHTTIRKRGQALAITAEGNIALPSADKVAAIAELTVNPDGSSISERVEFADVSFDHVRLLLSGPLPLSYEGTGRIGLSYSARPGRIETIGLGITARNGAVIIPGSGGDSVSLPVAGLDAQLSYAPDSGTVTITDLTVDSEKMSGRLTGTLEIGPLVDSGRPYFRDISFELSATGLRMNFPEVLDDPGAFASVRLTGGFNAGTAALNLTEVLLVHTDGFTFSGFVRAVWPQSTGPAQVTASLSGSGATGGLAVDRAVGLIPQGVVPRFRVWADRHIHSGVITSAVLTVNCLEGLLPLRDALERCITLDFAYSGAALKDMSTLPPIIGVSGRANMRDGVFSLGMESGQIDSWAIESGRYRSFPTSGTGRVEVEVNGPLSDLPGILGALMPEDCQKPELARPSTGVGQAKIIIDTYPQDQESLEFDVSVDGKLVQASRHNIFPGMHLTGANLDVLVRNRQVSFSGTGLFEGSAASLEWTNNGDEKKRLRDTTLTGKTTSDTERIQTSTMKAQLVLDAEQVHRVGLPESLFGISLTGRTGIDLVLERRACQTDAAVARLDLSDAALSLPLPGWKKEMGAPASGAVRYGRNPGGDAVVTADLRAGGLSLVADAFLEPDGSLRLLSIERVSARDGIDVSGRVRPGDDQGFVIDLRGKVFDAGRFIDQIRGGGFGQSNVIPVEASIEVSSLTRDGEEFLRDAAVSIRSTAGGLQTARMSGRISRRGDFKFALDTITGEAVRSGSPDQQVEEGEVSPDHPGDEPQARQEKRIKLRSDDAGRVMKVLTGQDILAEGEIAATAEVAPDESSVAIRIHRGKVRNMPILARVLSLASLSGLAAAQSGEGILFTDIEVPIRITPERVDVLDARASGRALGVTASGWVVRETGELSLTGYLVPSFGVNAALGGIPIIGDLFVSRSGEGIFAISYAISGTLDEAEARVEPLSLLTPGILRRAFENAPPPPTLAGRARANADSGQQEESPVEDGVTLVPEANPAPGDGEISGDVQEFSGPAAPSEKPFRSRGR